MIKKTYSENQAMVEKLWKQYQKDNNPKWLADICLNVPFFDHPPKIAKIKMTKIVAWVTLLTIGSDVNEIMERVTTKASNTSASQSDPSKSTKSSGDAIYTTETRGMQQIRAE